jgi:hypothetical protein
MDRSSLKAALATKIPNQLADDVVSEFMDIRQNVATGNIKTTASGKFIESVAQTLQYLERGSYDQPIRVDNYLTALESRPSSLSDDLRICANRVAKASYTLRNKRSIAHKGKVDPNIYDNHFMGAASQWCMAELLRNVSGLSMAETGRLVEQIIAPIGALTEDFGKKRIVLVDISTRKELLLLLHSFYPKGLKLDEIKTSLDRTSQKSVSSRLSELWREKLVEKTADSYVLTKAGVGEATKVLKNLSP